MTREEKLEEIRVRREFLGEKRISGIRSFTVLFWWVLFGFALLVLLQASTVWLGGNEQKGIGFQKPGDTRQMPMNERVKEAPKGSGM